MRQSGTYYLYNDNCYKVTLYNRLSQEMILNSYIYIVRLLEFWEELVSGYVKNYNLTGLIHLFR